MLIDSKCRSILLLHSLFRISIGQIIGLHPDKLLSLGRSCYRACKVFVWHPLAQPDTVLDLGHTLLVYFLLHLAGDTGPVRALNDAAEADVEDDASDGEAEPEAVHTLLFGEGEPESEGQSDQIVADERVN